MKMRRIPWPVTLAILSTLVIPVLSVYVYQLDGRIEKQQQVVSEASDIRKRHWELDRRIRAFARDAHARGTLDISNDLFVHEDIVDSLRIRGTLLYTAWLDKRIDPLSNIPMVLGRIKEITGSDLSDLIREGDSWPRWSKSDWNLYLATDYKLSLLLHQLQMRGWARIKRLERRQRISQQLIYAAAAFSIVVQLLFAQPFGSTPGSDRPMVTRPDIASTPTGTIPKPSGYVLLLGLVAFAMLLFKKRPSRRSD